MQHHSEEKGKLSSQAILTVANAEFYVGCKRDKRFISVAAITLSGAQSALAHGQQSVVEMQLSERAFRRPSSQSIAWSFSKDLVPHATIFVRQNF
jgi:hypothetical protein